MEKGIAHLPHEVFGSSPLLPYDVFGDGTVIPENHELKSGIPNQDTGDWQQGDFADFNMETMVAIDWTSLCSGYPYKEELNNMLYSDWWTPQVEKDMLHEVVQIYNGNNSNDGHAPSEHVDMYQPVAYLGRNLTEDYPYRNLLMPRFMPYNHVGPQIVYEFAMRPTDELTVYTINADELECLGSYNVTDPLRECVSEIQRIYGPIMMDLQYRVCDFNKLSTMQIVFIVTSSVLLAVGLFLVILCISMDSISRKKQKKMEKQRKMQNQNRLNNHHTVHHQDIRIVRGPRGTNISYIVPATSRHGIRPSKKHAVNIKKQKVQSGEIVYAPAHGNHNQTKKKKVKPRSPTQQMQMQPKHASTTQIKRKKTPPTTGQKKMRKKTTPKESYPQVEQV